VLLWSTGFIGAKLGLPYAEPMTFLALRFAIAGALLLAAVLAFGAPWPRSWGEARHIAVAGLLLHGVYLGGVFASIHHGVEAGVAALIVGIQPLLVAAAPAPLLGERVSRLQWLGFLLGVVGVEQEATGVRPCIDAVERDVEGMSPTMRTSRSPACVLNSAHCR